MKSQNYWWATMTIEDGAVLTEELEKSRGNARVAFAKAHKHKMERENTEGENRAGLSATSRERKSGEESRIRIGSHPIWEIN